MLDKYIDYSGSEGERYIPDKKLPVYEFLKKMKEDEEKGKRVYVKDWNFMDETGKEFEIKLINDKVNPHDALR